MEDNDFELRDKMLDYIHADLENCTHSELCAINKFIRTNIIAQLPNSENEEPKTNTQQLKAEILPHLTKVQSMLLASSTDTVEMLNQLRAIEVKLSAV